MKYTIFILFFLIINSTRAQFQEFNVSESNVSKIPSPFSFSEKYYYNNLKFSDHMPCYINRNISNRSILYLNNNENRIDGIIDSIKHKDSSKTSNLYKMSFQFFMGETIGLILGVVLGGIAATNAYNNHGDTSVKISDASAQSIMAGFFVLGHTAGSIFGVIEAGSRDNVRGSIPLAIIGGIAGGAGGLLLHMKWKNIGTAVIELLCAPLFSTLGYNLITDSSGEGQGQSSLINLKSRKLSFGLPEFYLTLDKNSNKFIQNIKLFNMKL